MTGLRVDYNTAAEASGKAARWRALRWGECDVFAARRRCSARWQWHPRLLGPDEKSDTSRMDDVCELVVWSVRWAQSPMVGEARRPSQCIAARHDAFVGRETIVSSDILDVPMETANVVVPIAPNVEKISLRISK
jgi:hypothetical protein